MAAEAKAMMDALMGQHRNAALSSDLNVNKKREETCYDPDVCPYYAVWGVDLWDLFVNTKSDIGGVNPKKVSDKSHDFYKKLSDKEQREFGGEQALLVKLADMVRRCDGIIRRNKEKMLAEQNKDGNHEQMLVSGNLDEGKVGTIARMQVRNNNAHSEIEKMIADEANLQDTVPEIIRLMQTIRGDEQGITYALNGLNYFGKSLSADMVVCEVSGNFMSSRDADERIAAHYAGKQYIGWKIVREKLNELRKKHGDIRGEVRVLQGPLAPPEYQPPKREEISAEKSNRKGYHERFSHNNQYGNNNTYNNYNNNQYGNSNNYNSNNNSNYGGPNSNSHDNYRGNNRNNNNNNNNYRGNNGHSNYNNYGGGGGRRGGGNNNNRW